MQVDKDLIRQQFGANAETYATSRVHARGASLERLLQVVDPQPDWRVLDIATAAGHTGFTFAPHVGHVWATDLTQEMVALATERARELGLHNVTVEQADAEDLPYDDGTFHLVTCRIAPHHFGDVGPFVHEAARVLATDGLLAVVDNVVPPGPAGDYVNAFEKLRDPSHGRCLSMQEWRQAYADNGLTLLHEETLVKEMGFDFWAQRHHATMQRYLRAMISEVRGEAADHLRPRLDEAGDLYFYLVEGLFVGRRG